MLKAFEVGDVLPATTQLRISWNTSWVGSSIFPFYVRTDGGNFELIERLSNFNTTVAGIAVYNWDDGYWISPYNSTDHAYVDINTSAWDESKRTISYYSTGAWSNVYLFWEDLNAPQGYSITFVENGGTTVTDLTEQTALPDPLPTPTKSGYTFVAWYYESSFQTRANAGDTIESNVTLYAKWHNLGSLFTEIANAIRSKDGTSGTIRDVDFGERVKQIQPAKEEETKTVTPNFASGNVVVTPTTGKVLSQVTINKDSNLIADNIKKDVTVHGITGTLEVGGAEMPSTAGGSIFTGATIPLTYKNNTHDYENNYEYKSATHNITITGLDGRATITGNGTKNVTVAFDVSSSTTSLKNFTITCVNEEQELTYKGLHAHYGQTVTGILGFACNNITRDGSEGTFGTSGLTTNYKFIVTSSSDLPLFVTNTTLWNTICSHQLLNVLIGNFSGTSIGDYFMSYCYSFNQPLTLPSGVSSIGSHFMYNCYAFNQPLTLPSGVNSIGYNFMRSCYSFNQPLTLPSGLSSIGNNFMSSCYSFNQPLTLPSSLSSIGYSFMSYCQAFNQPLTLPSGLSSIGDDFMYSCYAFNQPLTLPSGLSSIGDDFMYNCYSFNQPLTLPSGLSSIGDDFMYSCYAFNQPLTLPSGVSSIDINFMRNCYALSTIIWNASVYPTDNNSLSQSINTKTDSTYGAGIKVYGTKRAELISALPKRTSTPYRKLINGGS